MSGTPALCFVEHIKQTKLCSYYGNLKAFLYNYLCYCYCCSLKNRGEDLDYIFKINFTKDYLTRRVIRRGYFLYEKKL